MPRDHTPIRLDGACCVNQRAGSAGVQITAQRWRGQLDRHLSEQLMAESPAVGAAPFQHPRADEFGDDVVDVFGVASDHAAKQGEITGAPDDGGCLDHRHHVGVGVMQSGEQRLIQRLGHAETRVRRRRVRRRRVRCRTAPRHIGRVSRLAARSVIDGSNALISASDCSSVSGATSKIVTGQSVRSQ